MAGFWQKKGLTIIQNPQYTLIALLTMSGLVSFLHLPLALFVFILSALMAWSDQTENQKIFLLAALLPPVIVLSGGFDFFAINFFVVLFLILADIFVYKKIKSWSITIELMTLTMILALIVVTISMPEWGSAISKALIAEQVQLIGTSTPEESQAVIASLKPFSLGIFSMICILEGLLYAALGRWWYGHILPRMKQKEHRPWLNIRVSLTMLAIAAIAVFLAFFYDSSVAKMVAMICFVPFFCAGLSTVYWLYQQSKNRKKMSSFGFIWLIFAILYVSLLPLLLAVFGLLDVGIDFRKKMAQKQHKN